MEDEVVQGLINIGTNDTWCVISFIVFGRGKGGGIGFVKGLSSVLPLFVFAMTTHCKDGDDGCVVSEDCC